MNQSAATLGVLQRLGWSCMSLGLDVSPTLSTASLAAGLADGVFRAALGARWRRGRRREFRLRPLVRQPALPPGAPPRSQVPLGAL